MKKQNKVVENEKDLIKVMEEKFADFEMKITRSRNDKQETATKDISFASIAKGSQQYVLPAFREILREKKIEDME